MRWGRKKLGQEKTRHGNSSAHDEEGLPHDLYRNDRQKAASLTDEDVGPFSTNVSRTSSKYRAVVALAAKVGSSDRPVSGQRGNGADVSGAAAGCLTLPAINRDVRHHF